MPDITIRSVTRLRKTDFMHIHMYMDDHDVTPCSVDGVPESHGWHGLATKMSDSNSRVPVLR